MKIEDELYLVVKSHKPHGATIVAPSICDHNIDDLIKELKRIGVEIDTSNSEKVITYKIFDVERESTVPLRSSFDDPVKIIGYNLRNERLEMILRDYHHSEPTGRIGPVPRTDGIYCRLKVNGTYEDGEVIEPIKKLLREFYKIL